MANEDSRENSVMKGALELAAVGATVYGVYRGSRGLIKHYDDLGSTMLGKVGGKMTRGIEEGLSKFEKADGTNAMKEGLDNLQGKILEQDYKKAFNKGTSIFAEANPNVENARELREKAFNSAHEAFKNKSASDKRNQINIEKNFSKNLKEQMKNEATTTTAL